ncbi:dienelactone hydrolase family protein [Nostoc sp.]|uniref:dienelactone hydrolase family protein n=1 Tax=Nostoc sp. TaxID=1180 RepID=UPI002FFB3D5E
MTANFLRKIPAFGLFVLLNGIVSNPLKAQVPARPPTIPQVIPRDIQPPSTAPLPTPQPQQLPSPSQLLPPSTSTPNLTPEEQFPSDIPITIIVKRFEFVGSTIFNQEDLAKVTADFTNRPISPSEVFKVRDQITALYIKNGYITSGAYIPPQKFQSGVIKIQIIEGQLQTIEIKGTQRLNPNYVRSRIASATSGPLNQERLLKALQVFQRNPLIQNLSAELSEGDKPGKSKLLVFIKEAKTFSAQITLDNGRSPSVGSFQRRLQLNEANLLGLGDDLSVGYSNTDGSNFVNASYTLPLNPQNGTLSFNYGAVKSRVIEHPFNILDINSSSRYYELTFRQPIVQTPTQEIGAIGFCFGGHVAYIAATLPDIKATASFYGGGITTASYGEDTPTINRTSEIKGIIYAFFGTRDALILQQENKQIEAELKKHNINHRVFRYDAGHGFFHGFFKDQYPFITQNPSYNPEAAPNAWKHVLELFQNNL